ncbi:fasciclin-like arabinogalactan protein 4 [Rosa rugosa]|uniref:fasciclin-like arabinogalactan protein 4 n=1 Tax=Rosa rugosa TaxID=74645 RepID=UPI002B409904|nr:fasciclin-like arabinogalactan protein 4 [Rosa rugosa]
MAFTSPNPHFTPTHFLYFLLLTSSLPFTLSINITALLSPFPDLSDFTSLLSAAIFSDLSLRSSLTLLAVPNPFLSSTSDLTRHLSPSSRADVLRYHVLLEYLSLSDLARIPPSGKLVTTLYQTTGRATNDFGSVNLTRDPTTGIVSVRSPATFSPSNATVLGLVKTLPYNVSIFSVNSLLVPYGFDLMASETRPPLGLNITKALIDGHNFNVAASMLAASGVVEEFEADEGGAGITLFVPTDTAFSDLPANVRLQSLPADKKSVVLKFHVLHSYYPLGSLESIVNPVQPTLATELVGAGSYTLNISRNNGSVSINTGIIQASVTQTVFDQKPVAIFGVSRVLLPKEIFGSTPAVTSRPGTPVSGGAETPDSAPSPDNSMSGQELSSPPGFKEIKSEGAAITGLWRLGVASCCIALYVMV